MWRISMLCRRCAHMRWVDPVQVLKTCPPTNADVLRLSLSDIPSFASSSLLKSGKDLITRKDHERISFASHQHFSYRLDLFFWYDTAFGSPFGKILGIGYIQELVARLTRTPIPVVSSNIPDRPLIPDQPRGSSTTQAPMVHWTTITSHSR